MQVLWPGIVGPEGARSAGDAAASSLQGNPDKGAGGDCNPQTTVLYFSAHLTIV